MKKIRYLIIVVFVFGIACIVYASEKDVTPEKLPPLVGEFEEPIEKGGFKAPPIDEELLERIEAAAGNRGRYSERVMYIDSSNSVVFSDRISQDDDLTP